MKEKLLAYEKVGPIGSVDPKYDGDVLIAISYIVRVYCLISHGFGSFLALSLLCEFRLC